MQTETKKSVEAHNKAIVLLHALNKREKELLDIRTRLKHEENKPYTESFLLAPPAFYTGKIESLNRLIRILENKYFEIWN